MATDYSKLTKAALIALLEEGGPVEVDVTRQGLLKAVIASCEARAEEISAVVNPTNVYVLVLQKIADGCKVLLELYAERGHTGIPTVEKINA